MQIPLITSFDRCYVSVCVSVQSVKYHFIQCGYSMSKKKGLIFTCDLLLCLRFDVI